MLSSMGIMFFSSCKSTKKASKEATKTAVGDVEIIIPCSGSKYESTKDYFRATQSATSTDMSMSREKAMLANEDLEKYSWKISIAESALKELKKEQLEKITIDGYSYNINIIKTRGPGLSFKKEDAVIIEDFRVSSMNLIHDGFQPTRYSKRILRNGNAMFETIQKNKKGDTAAWRAVWNGSSMTGTISRRWRNGVRRDFSFISVGKRIKNEI